MAAIEIRRRKPSRSVSWIITQLMLITTISLSAFATDERKPLTITFQEQALQVAAVTPGATVYVYGLARESGAWMTNIVPRETRLTDDDHDGTIVWNLKKAFPWRSVWLAVELDSGRYVAAAPPEYPAQRIELTSTYLARNSSGAIEQLSFEGSLIECIVVRPTDGSVWSASVTTQGSTDRSTESGKITLRMTDLQRRDGLAGDPPPALHATDVLFVLNSFKGAYGVAQGGL